MWMVGDLKPISALGLTALRGPDSAVSGLSVDSRTVAPGDLFAALPGSRVHGAAFIDQALKRQAGAILTDPRGAEIAAAAIAGSGASIVVVEDARAAFAQACALWYEGQPETMVAITGTNGKTSVASFTRQIWEGLGYSAANIGTTGVEGAFSAPGLHTTPDPQRLHEVLRQMAAAGVDPVAMEASSHGLDQRRLDGVDLAAAAFTNFSQDHLDYHGTMEAYFDAKLRLFREILPEDGVAVVNLDDARGPDVVAACAAREVEVITVSQYTAGARLRIVGRRVHETGQDLVFEWQGRRHRARLDLIGDFQAMNAMTAAALAIAAGEDPEAVWPALPALTGVRGRMQLAARRANGAPVYVDYAHTPDALASALRALRGHVLGRIVCVFGAGGERDRAKRAMMGQAVAAAADMVIVTDDNPRGEDPAAIRAEILQALPDAEEVGDRAEAILRGVAALGPGDALLVAGKGHETGQQVGDTVHPFDDAEQASIAVHALEGRA